VSATRGTPIGAIAFVSAWSLFVVLWEWIGPWYSPFDGYFNMFVWLSTFGGFSLTVVYLAMSAGAFRGLADHPSKVGVYVASTVGVLIAGGAVFGGIYKQAAPFDKVWMVALVWLVLGAIVTTLLKGRPPASEALADLRSEHVTG
jgi:predicted MFS family arabinose efflux permease